MGGVHFWTKILGSALILCTGALGGKFMAARLERELEELSRFELALLNLSTEVSYSLSSLPKALLNAGHKAGGHTGALFSLIGSLCGLEQRRTVEEAFGLALERSQGLNLPARLVEVMTVLVRNLGVWGCKEQIGFIDMALRETRDYRASVQEEYSKKARMYRSLGLLLALGIVIVLM